MRAIQRIENKAAADSLETAHWAQGKTKDVKALARQLRKG